MSRVKGFNNAELDLFFSNLEEVMSQYCFSPVDIYNMGETGIGTVQEPGTILAPKGQKMLDPSPVGKEGRT